MVKPLIKIKKNLPDCLDMMNIWSRLLGMRFHSNLTEHVPLRSVKKKAQVKKARPLVDVKRVRAIGGKGGDGCVSFLRLWVNDKAGPDGGDGGTGAHVILQASTNVNSLHHIPSVIKGDDGEKGYSKDCHGKCAAHTIVKVPVGTAIKEESRLVGDLDQEDCMYILARGGAGGRGNHFFISDTQQSPVIAEYGAQGEEKIYLLEIKSVAHFGLVGLPNAGKSTLLQAISRARPKVAPYPFTTLKPHLGVVHFSDYQYISVADLPGLIEGSSRGRGLGLDFLRHASRCPCLVYILDISDHPLEAKTILDREISAFDPELAKKRCLFVLNKVDLQQSQDDIRIFEKEVGGENILAISAKFGTNITQLIQRLRQIFDEHQTTAPSLDSDDNFND